MSDGARPYVRDVLNSTGFDTSRPVLIVGNGPSLLSLDYDAIPADAYIFRCNWFFLEDHYRLGTTVDAFFWSIFNEGLMRGLKEAVGTGGYEVKSRFSPTEIEDRGTDSTDSYALVDIPLFNHWRLIGHIPELAHLMMMRPLPTQGVQMIATAVALGFKRIYTAGIDFYQSTDRRYAFDVPDTARSWLQAKDYSPGYESKHDLAVDLRALEIIFDTAEGVEFYNLGPDNPLSDRYSALPALDRSAEATGLFKPKPPRSFDELDSKPSELLWKVRQVGGEERRCAFVTFADTKFMFGVAALASSLSKVSDYPLIVMVPPGTDTSLLSGCDNVRIFFVEEVENPFDLEGNQRRFAQTFSKLNIFNLDFLDTAVFLDADALVLSSVDELFDRSDFAAAPDFGLKASGSIFNSGVFVCRPSKSVFSDMVSRISSLGSYDGGDQGFLNQYFPDWERLPRRFNTLKRVHREFPAAFDLKEIAVLHYVGHKPWQSLAGLNEAYKDLSHLWFSHLPEKVKYELFQFLRSVRLADQLSEEFVENVMQDSRLAAMARTPRDYVLLGVPTKHFSGEFSFGANARNGIVEIKPIHAARCLVEAERYEEAKAISEACLAATPGSSMHRRIVELCDAKLQARQGDAETETGSE
ncbi:MAG: alpha-2,3-sialyltransferase [Parasphingopyxis sp.]|uniref:alpha-2,3-sialyltransferase n=1 Tax=Parasphingopyxis sp. TaxID=1920299 RepID=UPI003F9FE24F